MKIGEKIKKYREASNLTQKQVALRTGMSEPAIRNYELGNRTPSEKQIEKIAKALNISPYAISITETKALEAYNTLRNYCKTQESCENCLLAMGEENEYGTCIMEVQDIPKEWQLLDLD